MPTKAHRKFPKICMASGMSDDAHVGWAKVHIQPHRCCVAYFAGIVTFCLSSWVMYGVGIPWPTPIMHIPCVITVSGASCMAALLWRGGPLAAGSPACKAAMGICGVSNVILATASFVGSEKLVPFQSRLVNILGSACIMFCSFASCLLGGNAADHPAEPYRSLLPPLLTAASNTIRSVDTFTDMGFVRILLQQVRPRHASTSTAAPLSCEPAR